MIRRKDLVDVGDRDYHERQGEFMQCQNCFNQFGGTRGDFFNMLPNDVFTCDVCGSNNIALVRIIKKIKIVKQ